MLLVPRLPHWEFDIWMEYSRLVSKCLRLVDWRNQVSCPRNFQLHTMLVRQRRTTSLRQSRWRQVQCNLCRICSFYVYVFWTIDLGMANTVTGGADGFYSVWTTGENFPSSASTDSTPSATPSSTPSSSSTIPPGATVTTVINGR